MAKSTAQKTYTLDPSWKQFFVGYLLSILTIPLAGIGLIALYFVRKKHKEHKYIITDTQISILDAKYRQNVDLANIEQLTIEQSWLQKKLGVGTLVLHTSALETELIGIENPSQIKDILGKAIQAELQRKEQEQQTKARQPKYKPGSMDKMEYLTGLWQQGLISEEDFEKERRHFE